MPTNDDYIQVAHEIVQYLNTLGLIFKTYKVSQLDEMLTKVAGTEAQIIIGSTARDFTLLLLKSGFIIYPAITDAKDGYIRVIRSNAVMNLLTALRYPSSTGDEDLANLLSVFYSPSVANNLNSAPENPSI